MRLFPGKNVYYVSDKLYQVVQAYVQEPQANYPLQVISVETWVRLSPLKEGRPEIITYLGDGEVAVWPMPDKKYQSKIVYLEQPKTI